ncbi:MAG TPA: sterol-binding protein [Burkholderiales bacterium]|nr:sterol-binding protein [Burkholderiales bacterium]
MLEPPVAAFINHLLYGADWAREALKPHAGKSARFEIAPFGFSFTVLADGTIAPAAEGAAAAATFRLTPGLLARIAARDESAWREVEAAGDAELAAVVNRLARELDWDLEEDLSRWFGDVAAHRMAETGRSLKRWGEATLEHLGRTLAEYWTEEAPLIAGAREVREFGHAVDELRDAVARLEARIARLSGERAHGR